MNKTQFIKSAVEDFVKISEKFCYKVVKMNEKEVEMSAEFKEELIKKGYFDKYYMGVIVPFEKKDKKININSLPNDSDGLANYKNMQSTKRKAIDANLKNENLDLLGIAKAFYKQLHS